MSFAQDFLTVWNPIVDYWHQHAQYISPLLTLTGLLIALLLRWRRAQGMVGS
jgi:hypothetical protein